VNVEGRSAFDAAALAHLGSLYHFARWLTGSDTEAKDLVQETYLRAIQAYRQFRPETNLRAWLFRIMRNRFIDEYWRRDREPLVLDLAEKEEGPDAHDRADPLPGDLELGQLRVLVRGDLNRALSALPEVYRTAVLLADVEGWRWEEVASALDVPIGTVQSRVFRGRRTLRALLRDYTPE
jgi:RNA polymerase sigma-70 factor (ECF subfamily)